MLHIYIYIYIYDISRLRVNVDRDSVVGIASTRYGLDGPGIESQWRRDSPHHPDRHRGSPSLLDNEYWAKAVGA